MATSNEEDGDDPKQCPRARGQKIFVVIFLAGCGLYSPNPHKTSPGRVYKFGLSTNDMEFEFTKNRIVFDKDLNPLDEFVLDFVKILDTLNVRYVLISGYVAILFGRNRASEDVDIFIEKIDFSKFSELWKRLSLRFVCINTEDAEKAYNEYLLNNSALRFCMADEPLPNMELKFPKISIDSWTMDNAIEVVINGKPLFVSPLELQIAFKLFLGSNKDIEDAVYLFELFKTHLNEPELNRRIQQFDVVEIAERTIWDS